MLRRTWVNVHLDALEHNMRLLQAHAAGSRVMGIVKADAYGCGAVAVAKRMVQCGIDYFGVSNIEEAIELRLAGIEAPMLILSYTPPEEAARLAAYRITQTVLSTEYARQLNDAAVQAGVTVTIHIKVDTGMSRIGFVCHHEGEVAATVAAVAAACRQPALVPEGIFTHFPSSDEIEDAGFTQHQFALFMTVINALAQDGITFALRHCCNSAGVLRYPEMHLDMVRSGLIQYGCYPSAWLRDVVPDMQPVMELKTTVSMVKDLTAGEPIGYGRTVYATAPMRVATVPLGYADGYPRALSNVAYMLVRGHQAPVVGRVCMDQCMLDVTGIDGVTVGDEVTAFGADEKISLPIEQIASWASTINYEVVCGVSRRVPRQYMDAGCVVHTVDYIMDK